MLGKSWNGLPATVRLRDMDGKIYINVAEDSTRLTKREFSFPPGEEKVSRRPHLNSSIVLKSSTLWGRKKGEKKRHRCGEREPIPAFRKDEGSPRFGVREIRSDMCNALSERATFC